MVADQCGEQTTLRSIAIDMTLARPVILTEVESLGKGFRKRVNELETAIALECGKPESPFESVRWGAGEVPIKGVVGGVFTLEIRMRKAAAKRR